MIKCSGEDRKNRRQVMKTSGTFRTKGAPGSCRSCHRALSDHASWCSQNLGNFALNRKLMALQLPLHTGDRAKKCGHIMCRCGEMPWAGGKVTVSQTPYTPSSGLLKSRGFKVGDKVKCIDAEKHGSSNATPLAKENVYTVQQVNEDGEIKVAGIDLLWRTRRFELVLPVGWHEQPRFRGFERDDKKGGVWKHNGTKVFGSPTATSYDCGVLKEEQPQHASLVEAMVWGDDYLTRHG